MCRPLSVLLLGLADVTRAANPAVVAPADWLFMGAAGAAGRDPGITNDCSCASAWDGAWGGGVPPPGRGVAFTPAVALPDGRNRLRVGLV